MDWKREMREAWLDFGRAKVEERFIAEYRAGYWLERSVNRYVLCGDNRDKLIKAYKKDLEFLYGSKATKYMSKLPVNDGRCHRHTILTTFIRDLVLADLGKFSRKTLQTGIYYDKYDKNQAEFAARYVFRIQEHIKIVARDYIEHIEPRVRDNMRNLWIFENDFDFILVRDYSCIPGSYRLRPSDAVDFIRVRYEVCSELHALKGEAENV